jgi:hypothetical protein
VAQLLNKLLIEQTKSRPRHSNDNGLVETKNGAVIRKHMGYGHIAAAHAEAIHRFYREHLNPCLNLHRPCAQADVEVDAKGRRRRRYRRYQTPLETVPTKNSYLLEPVVGGLASPLSGVDRCAVDWTVSMPLPTSLYGR